MTEDIGIAIRLSLVKSHLPAVKNRGTVGWIIDHITRMYYYTITVSRTLSTDLKMGKEMV
jgi:hypothetical protein